MLFLGEATFRFSLAWLRSGRLPPGQRCVATSFGDLSGPEKEANAAELRERFHCEVMDGVDATRLAGVVEGPFDRVWFAFPAPPRKGRVDLARTLLTEACASVAPLLSPDGRFVVALARGQARLNNSLVCASDAGGVFPRVVRASTSPVPTRGTCRDALRAAVFSLPG